MDSNLDSGVQAFLIGLDLDKYIPLFEKYGVTMKIFMSLTKDDLETMGIEQKDQELLLKYCEKFHRNPSKAAISDLKPEDVLKGIQNIDDHLLAIDASLSYTLDHLRQEDLVDELVNETTLSEITKKACAHTEKATNELHDIIEEMIKKTEKHEKTPSNSLRVTLLVIVIGLAIYFNMPIKK